MAEYLDTWSRERSAGKAQIAERFALSNWLRQLLGGDGAGRTGVEQTLVSGLDARKLARIVDVSHWQGDIDVGLMVKLGDVAMVLPKCSDGKQVRAGSASDISNFIDDKFHQNVQKCYDAGVPCGPYHYVQVALPDYTAQDLVNWNMRVLRAALQSLTPKVSYHAIMLDVEEKNATGSNAATVVMGMIREIKNDSRLSQVPLLIYSSMSVLNYYPALRDQLSYKDANQNLLMAQWVFTGSIVTTWANLIANYLAKLEMKVLTPGYANWWGVQYSAAFQVEGCSGRLDQSLYRSTKEGLWNWLGYFPAQPEDPGDDDEEDPQDPALAARVSALEAWRAAVKAVM